MKILGSFFVLLFTSQLALSDELPTPPVLKPVAISYAYAPIGFDSNDNAQFVVEGALPSTCYRASSVKIEVNKELKTISVLQMAYVYGGPCLEMLVPFNTVVNAGMLPVFPGYGIIDAYSKRMIGRIPIKQAMNVGPDDFLYAPISDAEIRPGITGGHFLSVNGVFMNSCAKLTDLKVMVQKSNRVLLGLPIATLSNQDSGCTSGYFRFNKGILLPEISNGRYLLHVRSLNGQAINKLVDMY